MCFTPPSNCVYIVYLKVTAIPVNCTISGQYFPLKSNTVHSEILAWGNQVLKWLIIIMKKKKVSFFKKILVDKQ